MRGNIKRIHFVGSEGVSMKMLKKISLHNGYQVSGSDISTGGHNAANVDGADLVVYSAAISPNNPELLRAAQLGISTISRAEFLGEICKKYAFSVAVAGSHGKTTTTAMMWEVLRPLNPTVHIGGNYNGQIGKVGGDGLFITEACEYKRSFLSLTPDIAVILNVDLDHTDCYSSLADLKWTFGEFAAGAKELVVYSGDEDDFLEDRLSSIPVSGDEKCFGDNKTCVVLNKQSSFGFNDRYQPMGKFCRLRRFPRQTARAYDWNQKKQALRNLAPSVKGCGGCISANSSNNSPANICQNSLKSALGVIESQSNLSLKAGKSLIRPPKSALKKKVRSIGFKRKNHYYASCISADKKGRYSFCVYEFGRRLGRVSLSVAGRHNVSNALAVIAVSRYLGLSFGKIAAGISRFYGAERRMEFLGYKEGCAVFSDYAHHPGEIAMSLLSARESCYKHVTVVFEPHTYTRTSSFFDGFVSSLAAADRVLILPIFAAREQPVAGVDSRLICDALKAKGIDSQYFNSYQSAQNYLNQNLKDDGILLFMGAGSIDSLARKFINPSNT